MIRNVKIHFALNLQHVWAKQIAIFPHVCTALTLEIKQNVIETFDLLSWVFSFCDVFVKCLLFPTDVAENVSEFHHMLRSIMSQVMSQKVVLSALHSFVKKNITWLVIITSVEKRFGRSIHYFDVHWIPFLQPRARLQAVELSWQCPGATMLLVAVLSWASSTSLRKRFFVPGEALVVRRFSRPRCVMAKARTRVASFSGSSLHLLCA